MYIINKWIKYRPNTSMTLLP